jgi:hypothetical protein
MNEEKFNEDVDLIQNMLDTYVWTGEDIIELFDSIKDQKLNKFQQKELKKLRRELSDCGLVDIEE